MRWCRGVWLGLALSYIAIVAQHDHNDANCCQSNHCCYNQQQAYVYNTTTTTTLRWTTRGHCVYLCAALLLTTCQWLGEER